MNLTTRRRSSHLRDDMRNGRGTTRAFKRQLSDANAFETNGVGGSSLSGRAVAYGASLVARRVPTAMTGNENGVACTVPMISFRRVRVSGSCGVRRSVPTTITTYVGPIALGVRGARHEDRPRD